MLKYSNIEYFKDSKTKNIDPVKDSDRKKSHISAGFTICDKKGSIKKIRKDSSDANVDKINQFVDDDIDMNYEENKSAKKKGVREVENIVPPLSLKNISMKNPQNKATGKKTQTTMQSTQIRDKILGNQPQKSMIESKCPCSDK